MRGHHKLGCLNCGKRRRDADIFTKRYDIYLKDSISKSLIRVGLCAECYIARGTLCLDGLKSKLEHSEECACKEANKPESELKTFKEARFVGRMPYDQYWAGVKAANAKTAEQFFEVIENERD